MPSPQRTGLPISWRFSIITTFAPCLAAHFAVMLPEGPAPMTRTSVLRFWTMQLPSGISQSISMAPTGQAFTQISQRVQTRSSNVMRVSSR